MAITGGQLLSVNVGRSCEFEYNGRPAKSAIWKTSVAGRVQARGVNLEGDDQADRKAHGGPDKAVYAYAIEDTRWWEKEVGRSLQHGQFGENLTTQEAQIRGRVVERRGDPDLKVIDRLAHKYTGKPFPFRDRPAERVVLVIAVERARYVELPFVHTPPQ
jgi:hypothetical protein